MSFGDERQDIRTLPDISMPDTAALNISGTSRHRTGIRASPSAEIYLVTQSPDAAHTIGIRYTPVSDGAARRISGAAAIIDRRSALRGIIGFKHSGRGASDNKGEKNDHLGLAAR